MTSSGTRSGAAWLASASVASQTEFLSGLTEAELRALPWLWDFWALPHQMPPEGRDDWSTWLCLGGRGAGKTRAGAEWVRAQVEGSRPRDSGRARRVALVSETIDQAREVMVFGQSGLLQCSPPDRRPEWIAGRRLLVWPNGATAQIFSAHDPESFRGPQFDAAWCDELAKWPKAQDAWDMLRFGLRLGRHPQACVTTTPRGVAVLKSLMEDAGTVMTHAPTQANRANLADGFLAEVQRRWAGTRMGRQEMEGVLLADVEGALWTNARLAECEVDVVPKLDRIVVAVDPPVTGHRGSDACGIVVVGVVTQGRPEEWRAYVLEDATVSAASPLTWAKAAIEARNRHGADRIVAEVNQGGALVESVLRQVDPFVPYKAVRAQVGKVLRAEPIAALYEQGRVHHARGLGALEDQMCLMSTRGFDGKGSPDRVDALVWALTETMVLPAGRSVEPRFRMLG